MPNIKSSIKRVRTNATAQILYRSGNANASAVKQLKLLSENADNKDELVSKLSNLLTKLKRNQTLTKQAVKSKLMAPQKTFSDGFLFAFIFIIIE